MARLSDQRLAQIVQRHDGLAAEMANPALEPSRFVALSKDYAELTPAADAARAVVAMRRDLAELEALAADPDADADMRALAAEELPDLKARLPDAERALALQLLPRDAADSKPAILEIRAGTGGDEASLFGADLLRMYLRYAERNGYKVEYLSNNMTDMGGVKEVVLSMSGKRGAYSRLKYESGVHRVQRVPETESQGRIHTSAATVAVLPEVDDVQIEIKESDLRIDTYRSSGAGGQHVNKTESAIRITHLPTGMVVSCQDEKSQLKNKEQAMRVLKSRLYDFYRTQQEAERAGARKSQIGSGDRSERIRTYNFPQGRVTDHRIGVTLYRLEAFLDGDMDELIDALILAERSEMLSGQAD